MWEVALKELPTEILFLLTTTGILLGENCDLRLPFLVKTENNIPLVEIYRNIITWPWPWESHFLGRLIGNLGVPKERGVWNSQGGRKDKLFFFLHIP
jgi:hypothetical protein